MPNLFLLAAPRSGSTQFAEWLASHKEIGLPNIKEPNYFSEADFSDDFVMLSKLNDVQPRDYVTQRSKKVFQFAVFRRMADYQYLYSDIRTQWKLDASTTYLTSKSAPTRMKEVCPSAKLIILTRDPLERAISAYRLAVRTGRASLSLHSQIAKELLVDTPEEECFVVRPSKYKDGVQTFHELYGDENILNLSFEEAFRNPEETLLRVARFLSIDACGFSTSVENKNASDSPRSVAVARFMQNSGIKNLTRRLLPRGAIERLRPLFFSHKKLEIAPSDIDFLKVALRE